MKMSPLSSAQCSMKSPISWIPKRHHVTKAVTGTTSSPIEPTSETGSVKHHSVRKRDVWRA